MNPEYFAQQVAAEALQAKYRRAYKKLHTAIVVAASLGNSLVKTVSEYKISPDVINSLYDYGIVAISVTEVSDGFQTTFDITGLRGDVE